MIARVCVFKREEESRETLKFVTLFSIKITFPRGEGEYYISSCSKAAPKSNILWKAFKCKTCTRGELFAQQLCG